jgi:hypothetical protein
VRWAAEQAGAAFGVADEAALTAVATALRARIGERLAATGAELAPLPVAGDILSNSAVLIPRSAEPVLDGAVSDIDAIWTEGFSVRVIGPYPAVSFASFGIDRADRATVRDAMSAFGLPRGFTEEDLKVARRALLMRAEADRREALVRQAEILACVARLGSAQAPVLVARVWSEGTSSSASKEVRAA